MARDIRELLRSDSKLSKAKMPEGHEARFLAKLDNLEEKDTTDHNSGSKNSNVFYFFKIAATVVIFLGLGYGAFTFLNKGTTEMVEETPKETVQLKTLGDVSPDLKKVEDYYIANINLELTNVEINDENKELIDGYILKLEELNKEYKRLSEELTEFGPNELTVSALIDNLKLRLNLLYRLKEQLKELENPELEQTVS